MPVAGLCRLLVCARPGAEGRVLANAEKALLDEYEARKRQVALLIQLRNLLTDELPDYLRSIHW